MTITEKAAELYEFFETKKRGEEDITILKENAPQSLRDSVMAAHEGRLPDDWIYSTYWAILGDISGYTIDSEDELENNRPEIVDGLVDVYTSDLTAWLNRSVCNVNYLEDARKEYGEVEGGDRMIAQAQYMAIDEIFNEVARQLTKDEDE
jgi:hypothetical protein